MTPVCTDTPNSARNPTPGRDAEVRAGDKERQQAANGRDRDVDHDQHRPFEGVEHGVEDDEDDENRDRQDDQQARVGALLAGIFSFPSEV